MVEDENKDTLWKSFNEFYKYANKLKIAYEIENLVDSLGYFQSDFEKVWQKKQEYPKSESGVRKNDEDKRILSLFENMINQVGKIREKSLEVEGQKPRKFNRIGKALKQLTKDKKPPFEPSYNDPEYVKERLAKFINFLESERNITRNYERWLVIWTIILSALISFVNVLSIDRNSIPWQIPVISAAFGAAVSIFTGILQFEKYHQAWIHKKIVATQLRRQYHRWKARVEEYECDPKDRDYKLNVLVKNCEEIILRDALDYASLFTERDQGQQTPPAATATTTTTPAAADKAATATEEEEDDDDDELEYLEEEEQETAATGEDEVNEEGERGSSPPAQRAFTG